MSDRRDRETERLVEELTATLEALRADLDEGRRRRRPPTPAELLRFTREYTIPTVVATLEATIAALELLEEVLRVVDAGRDARDRVEGASESLGVERAGESAVAGAERALSDLQRALADADLPEDPASRALITDARELSEEIRTRLHESREATSADAGGSTRTGTSDAASGGPERGVRIEVSDDRPDVTGTDSDDEDGRREDDAAAGVDVDAELTSIREEVRGDAADVDAPDATDDVEDDADETDGTE